MKLKDIAPQDELLSSPARCQQMIQSIREYAIFFISPDGLFGSWNPGVKEVLGYREDEFIGQPTEVIFTPEDRQRGEAQRELEHAEQHAQAMDDRWHVRKDGSRFWCNGVATAIYDDTGELQGFVKVMRDNTKEKQADEALEQARVELEQRVAERTRELQRVNEELHLSQARFKEIFDAGPFAAVVVAPKDPKEERFLDVNHAFSRLSGYERDEVLGRLSRELGMWSKPEDYQKLYQASDAEGEFRELELSMRSKSGEMKTILSSCVTIGRDGDAALLKMFYDVTEQRRSQEELMKAIEAVMQDTTWFSRSVVERLTYIRKGEPVDAKTIELTPRERQVLGRIAQGRNDREIAADLGITRQTVRNYVTNIYGKLGVKSRVEAVVWARERGIVG